MIKTRTLVIMFTLWVLVFVFLNHLGNLDKIDGDTGCPVHVASSPSTGC